MEKINYVILLDYCSGRLVVIKLTQKEKEEAEKHQDMDDFVRTLESKYGFRLKDSYYMLSETFEESRYNEDDK